MKKALLVVGGGMGDLLMTTPMFRALHVADPSTEVHALIVQSVNALLLEGNPFVHKVIDWNKFNGNTRGLISALRLENYDVAIHNHSCPRWRFYLIPFLAGIPKRFGFDRTTTGKGWKTQVQRKFLSAHVPYRAKSELRTRMNLDVLKLNGINNDDLSYDLHLPTLPTKEGEIVGIHPGSDGRGAIKRWPAEKFMELAEKLAANGKAVRFYIGPAEKELKETIKGKKGIDVVETRSIAELVLNMSGCSSFVSNDSGLSHIAAALKLPTVVLFGPTSPEEYELPVEHINVKVDQGFDCRACFRSKTCNVSSPTCMKHIEVERVYSAVIQLDSKVVEG